MEYPGSQELSTEARDRVLTAFQQVIAKLQEGRRDEAGIGLEFVLRLDPAFEPALQLQRQLASGAGQVDLSSMVDLLQGASDDEVEGLLVEAVEDFDERRLLAAREKAERVLRDVPGHEEARRLRQQVDEALRIEAQVGSHLAAAQEALEEDRLQDAAELVMLAEALEPRHPGLPALREALEAAQSTRTAAAPSAPPPPAAVPGEHDAPAPADGGFTFALEADEVPPGGLSDTLPAPRTETEEFSFGDAGASAPEAIGETVPGDGVSDVADLFATGDSDASPALEPAGEWALGGGDAGSPFDADASADAEGPSAEDQERVSALLEQGRAASERGDYQEAIDAFSRVFLVDPAHPTATQLVEEARQRKDELDRKLEHTLYEAQDAADAGDAGRALRLVEEILAVQPSHLEALELRDRLAPPTPADAEMDAPPPAAPVAAPPELEEVDDLLDDATTVGLPNRPGATPAAVAPAGSRFPLRIVGLALAALLVVAVGAFFGSRLLGGDDGGDTAAVERVLEQAEELYQQGRVEEAVHLLQEFPASGLEQSRVAVRLSKYQQALAPPTPTPIPQQLPAAQEALAEGRLLDALRLVEEGLAASADDAGLLELRERIQQQEPLLVSLQRAQQAGDWETAASVSRDLVGRYPGREELRAELERSLFNLAVAQLRAYNFPGAAGPVNELQRRRPDDPEVQRIAEFIEQYRSRPVDMQQRIFVASLKTR